MGTRIPRRKSWTRRLEIPGSVLNQSLSSIPIPPASVYVLPQSECVTLKKNLSHFMFMWESQKSISLGYCS